MIEYLILQCIDSKRKIVIRGNVDQIESAQVLIEEKIGEEEIKKEHEVLDLIEPQQNKDRIKEHRNVTQIHQKQDVKEDSDVADIQHKEEDIEELNVNTMHNYLGIHFISFFSFYSLLDFPRGH